MLRERRDDAYKKMYRSCGGYSAERGVRGAGREVRVAALFPGLALARAATSFDLCVLSSHRRYRRA